MAVCTACRVRDLDKERIKLASINLQCVLCVHFHIGFTNGGCSSFKPGPLLLQLVGLPGGLGEDPPLGDEHDMLAGELLLELPDQPGLDLLEGLQLGHGDEDHDSLLSTSTVNLAEAGIGLIFQMPSVMLILLIRECK